MKLRELAFGGFAESFMVGVLSDGRFLTQGENIDGRLTPPAGIGASVKRLAAGDAHVVALLEDGSVVAWGRTNDGQCTVPTNLGTCTAVAAGLNFSAALKADGTVAVWGSTNYGVRSVPPNATNVVRLSAASFANHFVALRADGTVVAWGRTNQGQCTVPPGLSNVVEVAAGGQGDEGDDFSLALKADGKVVAWGSNSEGQALVPSGLTNALAISAGDDYAIALRADGKVVGWGREVPSFGTSLRASRIFAGDDEAAVATPNGYLMPTGHLDSMVEENLAGIIQISSGYDGNCLALRNNGTVVAWGRNDENQSRVPAGLNNVVMVSAGDDYSLALRSDGKVVYWGGDSDVWKLPNGLAGIARISAGNDFALAVKRVSGEVIQWGAGFIPQPPPGLLDVAAVSAGDRHALALKADGTVVAWGNNGNGECNVPVGLSGVVGIAAASEFSLALKADGTVVGWGNLPDAAVPPALTDPATAKVRQISASENHALALREDGSVVAWGPPSSNSALLIPPGLQGVRAVAAGGGTSIALVGDGRLPQEITFAAPAPQTYGPGKAITLSARASSGLPVTFESLDTNAVTLSNNTAIIRAAKADGVKIVARQSGSANYFPAADVTNTVIINKANQSIRFAQPAAQTYAPGKTFTLSASASSGLGVTFDSLNPNVATVLSNVVTIVGAGQAELLAKQVGDSNYNAASNVVKTLSVAKMNIGASVTFSGTNHIYAPGTNWGVGVTTLPANLAVVVTYGGSTNPPTNAGTYKVVATINDPNYQGVTHGTMVVAKAGQIIDFKPLGAWQMRAGTNEIVITGNFASASSGLPLAFTSSHPSVAGFSGNKLAVKWPSAITNLTITARQGGGANYLPAAPVTGALTLAPWPFYVDGRATSGANDGSSWDNAFTNLQSALDLAKPGDEIWVAAGVYKPTAVNPAAVLVGNANDPKAVSFTLKAGVAIYGGFAGNETLREERDPEKYDSVLSGDLAGNDDWSWKTSAPNQDAQSSFHDNAYTVVFADRLSASATLDGLTITGGNANGLSARSLSPGVIGSFPPSRDTSFNIGGGIICYSSDLVVRNCFVWRNLALGGGAGLFAFAGPTILKRLDEPSSIIVRGRSSGRIDVSNSRFEQNIVPEYNFTKLIWCSGGGVSLRDNIKASFRGVEFLNNSAPSGGAITLGRAYSAPASATPVASFYRCLFEGNTAVCSPAPAYELPGTPDVAGMTYLEDGNGGAIQADAGNVNMASCAFISNQAFNPYGYSGVIGSAGGGGGAMHLSMMSKGRVATSLFYGNSTASTGGAIYIADWESQKPGSALEIYFSTIFGNSGYWAAGAGVNNYRAKVKGYGNIFYENRATPIGGNLSDFHNEGTGVSSISVSMFTQDGTVNFNGAGNFSRNTANGNRAFPAGIGAQIFRNCSEFMGLDGEFGTKDDGFNLAAGSPVLNLAPVALPVDFADADGDGKVTEPLPLDAKGESFGSGLFDLGAYQHP